MSRTQVLRPRAKKRTPAKSQHQIRATPPRVRDDAAPMIVTSRRAEQILCVSHRKLYELLHEGELESFTIGRGRRITVRSINALIERRLGTAAAATKSAGFMRNRLEQSLTE